MKIGHSFPRMTAWLITLLLGGLGSCPELALSHESVEQERTLCIKECKDRYITETTFIGRGGGTSDWRLYFICIDNCERKFWKEWQKKMDEIDD